MLSRVNRVTRAADFRSIVRTGRRVTTANSVVYVSPRGDGAPTRFGFVVSKAVGNSVARHLVTRRLRAIGYEILPSFDTGADVVVRALPGSVDAAWTTLHGEIAGAMTKAAARKSEVT